MACTVRSAFSANTRAVMPASSFKCVEICCSESLARFLGCIATVHSPRQCVIRVAKLTKQVAQATQEPD